MLNLVGVLFKSIEHKKKIYIYIYIYIFGGIDIQRV
jgi:hypothetical protein